MEHDGAYGGQESEHGIPPQLLEVLAGLDSGVGEAIVALIGLYREFPTWAVWLPSATHAWTAVRPASARPPSPDLPMIWVHTATAELADRMRGVDAQLTPP